MSTQTNNLTITTDMLPIGAFPVITEQTILKEALEEMDNFRLGVACVVNNKRIGRFILARGSELFCDFDVEIV